MDDPWQPSPDDIRVWANTTTDPWNDQPCENWPLALAWSRHEKTLLELASDTSCPSREFIVFVLHFIVGHAVHSDFKSVSRSAIEGFVHRADNYFHPDIQCWQERCWRLLKNLKTFNYEAWCGGDLEKLDT